MIPLRIPPILSYFLFVFILHSLSLIVLDDTFADSPKNREEEIRDNPFDLINTKTNQQFSKGGEKSTDILSVDYSSNGRFLNATLWLYFPFKEIPSHKELDYGMFIDSDFNSRTGFGGIDYKVELQWNKNRQVWDKVIETWSPLGEEKVVDNQTNYTNFYEKGKKYVELSVDLVKIQNPEKYKVLFYADSRNEDDALIIDTTRWIAIPQLHLLLSTFPTSVELFPGQEKVVEVKINSTEGYEPIVNFKTENKTGAINLDFIYDQLRIPSYGMATTPLIIKADKSTNVGPYTLFIFANSNFPPEELLDVSGVKDVGPYNIEKRSTLLVNVNPEPNALEKIGYAWSNIGGPIEFIIGTLVGGIIGKIREIYELMKKKSSK